jgi:hypothetical protein
MKRPERPSAVLVVAILQICFGSLGLLGSLCGGGAQLAGGSQVFTPPAGAQAPPDVDEMMSARVPYYTAFQAGGAVLGLISGTVMIVSAIGLLKLRPWARHLTIGYACYDIVSLILNFIFSVTVSLPVMNEVWAEMRADPKFPAQAAPIMNITETLTTALIYAYPVFLVYPIALLVVMFLPHVREAFRPVPLRPADKEELDDESVAAGEEAAPPDAPREEGVQPGEEAGER